MKKFLVAAALCATVPLHAAAPPRGESRLHELVLLPEINLNFSWGLKPVNNAWEIRQAEPLPEVIARQREELKQQPGALPPLMRLASLLDEHGETNESAACYRQAEELCRTKIAAHPQDGPGLTMLGVILNALNRQDEAESKFRAAVLVSSNEWRCWAGLGSFVQARYFNAMFPDGSWLKFTPGVMPSQKALDFHPPAEALKRAEAANAEAASCFDRALTLAPKEPDVFIQRAGFLMASNWNNCLFRHYRGDQTINSPRWLLSGFSPETIASLKRAAELNPDDWRYSSLATFFELTSSQLHTALAGGTPSKQIPEAVKESLRPAIARLQRLAESPDKKIAAGALENLSLLDSFQENHAQALAEARRAVALDPSREPAWDLFVSALRETAPDDKGEVVAALQSRLKGRDTAHTRLMLGKFFAQMEKWDDAREQAGAAARLEPENPDPPLLLAAVALKAGETNFLEVARTQLDQCAVLGNKQLAIGGNPPGNWRALALDDAIFLLFIHQPEQAARLAKAALNHDPDDAVAAEILKHADEK